MRETDAAGEDGGEEEEHGFGAENRPIGEGGKRDELAGDVDAERAGESADGKGDRLRRAPQAHAGAGAPALPIASEAHHRADRRNGEHAVAEPQHENRGAQRKARPGEPARGEHGKRQGGRDAAAGRPDARRGERGSAQCRSDAAHGQHADEHAAVLHPGELRARARCHGEHDAREGVEDQFLRAVGEHGNEDEQRETAGGRFIPDLPHGCRETGLVAGVVRLQAGGHRTDDAALQPRYRRAGEQESEHCDRGCHRDEAGRRERLEEMPGERRRHREAEDHHDPDGRRGGGATLWCDVRREEREDRRAGSASPDAEEEKTRRREREAKDRMAREQRGGEGGSRAAERKHPHAPDDPRRASPADVRSITPRRPEDLHPVMGRDEQARDEGREADLDDHHAIDGRGHEDDDGAQRSLDEAETDDAEPAQGVRRRPRRLAG